MKLTERINRGGSVSYQIDYGVVGGRRKRVAFADKVEAEKALAAAKGARKRLGTMGVTASPLEMAEFLAVKERLRETGVSILEAVEFFMQRGLKVARPKLLPAVIEDFIWSRRELGRDARTIQTYTHVLGSLARAWPLRLAHDLTHDMVRSWLRGTGWAASTQNKAVGHVRGLYQWAITQKHAGDDPCVDMERLTVTTEEIEGLTLKQCEAVLMTGLRVPRLMPFVVLGLFRGMRRSELQRLRFEELDLDEGTAIAAAKKVKTRQRRVVEISAQMMAWIAAAGWTAEMMQEGPVAPSNLKDLWPRFWKMAGLKAWPHNGLRHTFASMHYAMFGDESALQSILGQRSKDVLHSNYRALKTKREAELFWGLMPPEGWVPPVWSLRDAVFSAD